MAAAPAGLSQQHQPLKELLAYTTSKFLNAYLSSKVLIARLEVKRTRTDLVRTMVMGGAVVAG